MKEKYIPIHKLTAVIGGTDQSLSHLVMDEKVVGTLGITCHDDNSTIEINSLIKYYKAIKVLHDFDDEWLNFYIKPLSKFLD